ncbi:hypothetical protein SALBM311S_12255 [Streptomyces alboniger]
MQHSSPEVRHPPLPTTTERSGEGPWLLRHRGHCPAHVSPAVRAAVTRWWRRSWPFPWRLFSLALTAGDSGHTGVVRGSDAGALSGDPRPGRAVRAGTSTHENPGRGCGGRQTPAQLGSCAGIAFSPRGWAVFVRGVGGGGRFAQFPAPLEACGGPRGPVGACVAHPSGGWVGAGVGGIRPRSGGSVVQRPCPGRRPLRADTPDPVPFTPYASARRPHDPPRGAGNCATSHNAPAPARTTEPGTP